MGGPKRPDGEELLRRMRAWGDAWRAVAGSTKPADRPRAEAAIASLYVADGKPAPMFAWVPSPAAGLLAYVFASIGHRKVVSAWARGDIGNGDNREFNGLADPFGMEPASTIRLSLSARDRIPDVVGRLWRRRIDAEPTRWGPRREEPVVMVEVLNSTPEPDGTQKTYFLRVPPKLRTAREAVAWTFGLSGSQYRPEKET